MAFMLVYMDVHIHMCTHVQDIHMCEMNIKDICPHVHDYMQHYLIMCMCVHKCISMWKSLYMQYVDDACMWMHICMYKQAHMCV